MPDLLQPHRPERADAARNRRRVLEAAARLVRERGLEAVSMDDVAVAAGVGKGTLYRRFGDRAGLARALLDDQTRRLQEAIVRGAPPLGPGAPPGERLVAFIGALADLAESHGELMREADAMGKRPGEGAVYAAWRAHVALLLREARPDLQLDGLPDVLLAGVSSHLHRHLRTERNLSAAEVRAAMQAPAAALVGAAAGAR